MAQVFTEAEQAARALRRCSETKNLRDGRRVHDQIITSGFHQDRFLSNLLIQMYGKCGCMEDAKAIFDNMSSRNTFTWSILLTAYAQNGHHTEALQVYEKMENQRIKPHRTTMVSAITACAVSGDVAQGKELHSRAVFHGLHRDVLVSNSLISMYGKCHCVREAEAVFESSLDKDSATWNSMLCAYTQNGQAETAVELYKRMDTELRDSITYVSVLEACGALQDLELAGAFNRDVSESKFRDHLVVGTALVSMYGRCRSLQDALRCFDSMPVKNVVTWNALITVYVRNGEHTEVLRAFQRMDQDGYKPNPVTFLGVVEAVSKTGGLSVGRNVQQRIDGMPTCSVSERVSMGNALITMYGKLGSLKEARSVFEKLKHHRSVITWTALITGYAQNGYHQDAVEAFREMVSEDVKPDAMAYASVLGATSNLGDVLTGRVIHERIRSSGIQLDAAVETALISLYGKCNHVEDARSVLDGLVTSGLDDQPAWNAMLAAYAQNGHADQAVSLYTKMVKPDGISFVTVLAACSASNRIEDGRRIHADALKLGYRDDDPVGSALINLYGKCSCLDDAWSVFRGLRTTSVVVWNAMITALANNSGYREAVTLFHEMDLEGVKASESTFTATLVACVALGELKTGKEIHERISRSGLRLDQALATTLIGLYGKCSSLHEAEEVYVGMAEKDLFCVSAMIGAYAENGQADKALQTFAKQDLEGMKPDEVTFISVLSACSNVSQGKSVHEELRCCGHRGDGVLGTALVCMYARCGNLDISRHVFDKMTRKDSVSWSAMITAFAQHGSEAKLLFHNMVLEGIEPENPTFTSMLFSCCHAGVVDRARECFVLMVGEFGLKPTAEHYCCIVNLLGRAGRVREADDLIQNMPYEPDYVPWMTLLGACNTHGSLQQGTDAAQGILQTGSNNSGTFVLLSSLLSSKSQTL